MSPQHGKVCFLHLEKNVEYTCNILISDLPKFHVPKLCRRATDSTESSLLHALDEHNSLLAFDDASYQSLCETVRKNA